MTRFEVEVRDLRAALASVLPHVDHGKDPGALGYVRLLPGAQNLTCMATDRFSLGLGLVSIWEHEDEDLGSIDLHHEDVRRVLDVFKNPGKDVKHGEAIIRITTHHTSAKVSFTDAAGLFDGVSLTVPSPGQEAFPALDRAVARLLASTAHTEQGEPVHVNPATLARFTAAGRAYGEALVFEFLHSAGLSSGTALVRCGESFIGAVQLLTLEDSRSAEALQWREDWQMRLPDPIAGDPDGGDGEPGDVEDVEGGEDLDEPPSPTSNVTHVNFIGAGEPR